MLGITVHRAIVLFYVLWQKLRLLSLETLEQLRRNMPMCGAGGALPKCHRT
jgi:hypothetical protein